MVLSTAMMCDYLADERGNPKLAEAARRIRDGVDGYLASGGALPTDQGGTARTGEIVEAICAHLGSAGR